MFSGEGGSLGGLSGHATAGTITVPLELAGDPALSADSMDLQINGSTEFEDIHLPLPGMGHIKKLEVDIDGLLTLMDARPTPEAQAESGLGAAEAGLGADSDDVEVVGDSAQHFGDLPAAIVVRVLPAAQAVGHAVEQFDHILDDRGHLIRRCPHRLGDARGRFEDLDRQRLSPATPLDDAELDTGAWFQRRGVRR